MKTLNNVQPKGGDSGTVVVRTSDSIGIMSIKSLECGRRVIFKEGTVDGGFLTGKIDFGVFIEDCTPINSKQCSSENMSKIESERKCGKLCFFCNNDNNPNNGLHAYKREYIKDFRVMGNKDRLSDMDRIIAGMKIDFEKERIGKSNSSKYDANDMEITKLFSEADSATKKIILAILRYDISKEELDEFMLVASDVKKAINEGVKDFATWGEDRQLNPLALSAIKKLCLQELDNV